MPENIPKNIVVCSDGTGNTANKNRGTNVFKLYEAVDIDPPPQGKPRQLVFYDDGVGTESLKFLRVIGGAFGYGLSRNVRQLYTAIARVYRPGDRIYLFGFSRGAFTVRSLAGWITGSGLVAARIDEEALDEEALDEAVKASYKEYRENYKRLWRQPAAATERGAAAVVLENGRYQDVPIAFIGVWDTVDAVGLPFDELIPFWNAFVHPFKFPDQKLSPLVCRARHALSLDDERKTFHPLLWNEAGEDTGRILQVWFAGVHSNVGGGYVRQGMSLVALKWMMDEAEQFGLRFVDSDRQIYREHANVHDKLYDSRSGLASYYHYKPRDIGQKCRDNSVMPRIHHSALERAALSTEGYFPDNWPDSAHVEGGPLSGQDIKAVLGQAVFAEPLLLSETGRYWKYRTIIYYVLLVFSIGLLLAHLTPQAQGDYIQVLRLRLWPDLSALREDLPGALWNFGRELWNMGTQFSLSGHIENLLPTAWNYWYLTAVIAVAFLVGLSFKRKQKNEASKYWRKISGALRKALGL